MLLARNKEQGTIYSGLRRVHNTPTLPTRRIPTDDCACVRSCASRTGASARWTASRAWSSPMRLRCYLSGAVSTVGMSLFLIFFLTTATFRSSSIAIADLSLLTDHGHSSGTRGKEDPRQMLEPLYRRCAVGSMGLPHWTVAGSLM
jgi:hypothetical protein